jgi:hypothetical protein
MTVQLLQQGPPPYVRFEQRAEEDRAETIKQGRLVMRDVNYVIIARAGRKDTFEQVAEDWFAHCERMTRETPPKWPPDWLSAHRKMYDQFLSGQEVTQPGFPIRQWAAISKAVAENLVTARILTVESLAAADEAALATLGIGGRALRDKARAWLEQSKDNKGEELAALRADNATLTSRLDEQAQKIAELEAALAASANPAPQSRRRASAA